MEGCSERRAESREECAYNKPRTMIIVARLAPSTNIQIQRTVFSLRSLPLSFAALYIFRVHREYSFSGKVLALCAMSFAEVKVCNLVAQQVSSFLWLRFSVQVRLRVGNKYSANKLFGGKTGNSFLSERISIKLRSDCVFHLLNSINAFFIAQNSKNRNVILIVFCLRLECFCGAAQLFRWII